MFIYGDTEENYSSAPILDISSCLFALGVDGSIGSNLTALEVTLGTGLNVFLYQTSYKAQIVITNTIAYRNQGNDGGNLQFVISPVSCDVILLNVMHQRNRL